MELGFHSDLQLDFKVELVVALKEDSHSDFEVRPDWEFGFQLRLELELEF